MCNFSPEGCNTILRSSSEICRTIQKYTDMKTGNKNQPSHSNDESWENRDKRRSDSSDRGSGNTGGSNTGGNSRREDDEQSMNQ